VSGILSPRQTGPPTQSSQASVTNKEIHSAVDKGPLHVGGWDRNSFASRKSTVLFCVRLQ
jgi:hypothetical protein